MPRPMLGKGGASELMTATALTCKMATNKSSSQLYWRNYCLAVQVRRPAEETPCAYQPWPASGRDSQCIRRPCRAADDEHLPQLQRITERLKHCVGEAGIASQGR